jgi:alpha-amylase
MGDTDKEPSLQELNTGSDYVRQRIADFLTELISVGITGFSVYYGKYIDPDDYIEIFKKFRYNLGNEMLPIDFIGIIEIQVGNLNGEFDRLLCNPNYHNFGVYFENKLKAVFPDEDVFKFKIEVEDKIDPFCPNNPNPIMQRYSWSLENQEIQKHGSGGIQEKFTNIIEHYNKYSEMLKDMKEIKIRKIFSSYSLPLNGGNGFPDGKSDCTNMTGCIIVGGSGCS